MKKIILLSLFIGFVLFIPCDGQDRLGQTNLEILNKNELLDSFSEKIERIPNSHVEINTDTTLYNGYRIKVRYFRHFKEYVSKQYKKDSINHIKYYYDFGTKITVFKNSEEIFKKDIFKYSFEENNKEFITKVSELIMQPTYIDYEKSINFENVVLVFPLCNTDNKNCITYQLTIDHKGLFNFKELK